MSEQLNVGEKLTINGIPYSVGEHPSFPGMPFGQEGRQGIVYQLLSGDATEGKKAMKVFKPGFRNPSIVYLSESLGQFASIQGLQVCERETIIPQRNTELLSAHPDLLYAVIMPWIDGPTWMDILLEHRELTQEQSMLLTRSLAEVLAEMEQRGTAHCDLSSPNILIPYMADTNPSQQSVVQLVDIEQMYSSKLDRPELLPQGSPGYAMQQHPQNGVWSKFTDRFSGSVILAEMLAWCDPEIRKQSWGESYFDPEEMQTDCERYQLLHHSLATIWGDEIAQLFKQAWQSSELMQCPSFGEWYIALTRVAAATETTVSETAAGNMESDSSAIVSEQELIRQAMDLANQGNIDDAILIYARLKDSLPVGSNLYVEIEAALESLYEEQLRRRNAFEGLSDEQDGSRIALFIQKNRLLLIAGVIGAVLISSIALWFFQPDEDGTDQMVIDLEDQVQHTQDDDSLETSTTLDLESETDQSAESNQPEPSATEADLALSEEQEDLAETIEEDADSESEQASEAITQEPPKSGSTTPSSRTPSTNTNRPSTPSTPAPKPSTPSEPKKETPAPQPNPEPKETTPSEPATSEVEKETVFIYSQDVFKSHAASISRPGNYFEDKKNQWIGFDTSISNRANYLIEFKESFDQFRTVMELVKPSDHDVAEIEVLLDGKLVRTIKLTKDSPSSHVTITDRKFTKVTVRTNVTSEENTNLVLKWPHVVREIK